ncbi:MAG: DUF4893 domain-containing protein [Sphingomonas sp.]
MPPPAATVLPVVENWRASARPADIDRIARIEAAWDEALARARGRALAIRIAAAGAALDRSAAMPRAAPPPGSYRCRLSRLGAAPGVRAVQRFPAHFCHVGVEGALLSFAKQTGSERMEGYLFADSDSRMIFLGARGSTEGRIPAYSVDETRDVAGIVERTGPLRYRIVIPWPRGGGALEVIELAPIAPALD